MPSNNLMAAVAKRSDLLFFIYDLTSGRFVDANQSFFEFFDLKKETLNQVRPFDLLHEDDKGLVSKKIKECLEKKHVIDVECRFIRGTNQRMLTINAYLEEIETEKFVIGHAKDITISKAYIENLNNHNSKKNSILNILFREKNL